MPAPVMIAPSTWRELPLGVVFTVSNDLTPTEDDRRDAPLDIYVRAGSDNSTLVGIAIAGFGEAAEMTTAEAIRLRDMLDQAIRTTAADIVGGVA